MAAVNSPNVSLQSQSSTSNRKSFFNLLPPSAFSDLSTAGGTEEKNLTASPSDDQKASSDSRHKTLISFSVASEKAAAIKKLNHGEGESKHSATDESEQTGEIEPPKNQNLRPKRLVIKKRFADERNTRPYQSDFPTFSLSLPQEEIKKDILAMTGRPRLSRNRKKKRPTTVQGNLDILFPGS